MISPKVVCDTNIVSYLMKEHTLAHLYKKHLQGKLLSIAFMTVGELYYGAEIGGWLKQKREKLNTALKNFVVIPYDHEIALCYAKIASARKKLGKTIPCADAWIAACALRHNIPLVTHNAKHFVDIPYLNVITEYVEQ
ncbi:type II toxin-antitoxin system VapC family toxin [bacterium]|nr:type II toxin-antitoxin system VapC family toxin [bacterium]